MLSCCLLAGCEACDVDASQSILLEAPSWARGAEEALLSSESDAEFTSIATVAARASSERGWHVCAALSSSDSSSDPFAEYNEYDEIVEVPSCPPALAGALNMAVFVPQIILLGAQRRLPKLTTNFGYEASDSVGISPVFGKGALCGDVG